MKYPDDFINKIICGDCLEVMKAIKPNSIDAIVTDPPYGLEFMGKEWDKLRNTWKADSGKYHNDTTFLARGDRIRYQAGLEMQLWHTQWLTEAYRVLKPGASMLVMGGTRTFHRLMVAIEDTGFIIKDTLMWIYGSGFPKAQDLGKMIDKRMGKESERKVIGHYLAPDGQWRDYNNHKPNEEIRNPETHYGYKTSGFRPIDAPVTDLAKHWGGFKVGGIKPAYEPIVWAVKPPEGSYIDNVLKWGVGAVNVDECRVNNAGKDGVYGSSNKSCKPTFCDSETVHDFKSERHTKGRFPANIILDEEAGRMLDEQSGESKSSGGRIGVKGTSIYEAGWEGKYEKGNPGLGDSGGASRFFYCAKASRGERGEGNVHPTVKPIALFKWLIQLVTREGQIVLDPFFGSGTTGLACNATGRKYIGIEKGIDYCKIAEKRLAQGVL